VNHQFSVIIDFAPDGNDQILDLADALGDADCLDASIGGHSDGIEAVFNREASSLDTAIKSAITAVESAGFKVHRVELPRETINLTEIGS
jgi:hypothetical protein